MTIDLYTTTDDNRVVNKTLTAVSSNITVRPTESLDLLAPVFYVDTDDDYLAANYLYCSTFDRYYYINDIKLETGRRMSLHCSLDVLYTYRNYLSGVTATVIRSESLGRPSTIPDKRLPVDPQRYELKSVKFSKTFPQDINKPSYVLIT